MSDQHKYTLVSNQNMNAYVLDKTSGSELVVIDKTTTPPTTARFDLGEGGLVDKTISDLMHQYTTPAAFGWQDHPLAGKMFRDSTGKSRGLYDIDYTCTAGKVTYYVQTDGNDSNDGLTYATALKTLAAAVAKADVGKVILCDRMYTIAGGFNGVALNKSIIIQGLYGSNPVLACHYYSAWSLTSGKTKTYQQTQSNTITVVDISRRNSAGLPLELTLKASIDEVEATADTYYISGSIVYVHVSGDGAPSTSKICPITTSNSMVATATTSGFTLKFKGITFLGGATVTGHNNTDSFMMTENCNFLYGKTTAGNSFAGSYLYCIHKNGISAYAKSDGFNYQNACKFIEIDCQAFSCGVTGDNSSNATTSHDGTKGVRINSVYHDCVGPIVADVIDNTETWNVGCTAYNSLNDSTGDNNANFSCQQGSAKMYLEDCVGYGSTYGVQVANTCQVYIRGVRVDKPYKITSTNATPVIEY